jgi:MFS family permease
MHAARQELDRVGRARIAVTSAFAAHAVVAGLLGPWVPQLKRQAGLDPGGLGIALTGYAVGLLSGTRLAGPAVRAIGGRAVVRAGIPVLALGFALLPLSNGLLLLVVIFLAVGVASGLVDVAMNIEAVDVERRFGRRVMTAIHGTWSVSLLVGAGVASLGVAGGIPVGVHLPLAAALVAAGTFPFLRWLPPAKQDEASRGATVVPGARSGSVLPLCVVAGASFLIEGVAIEWTAVFLHEEIGTEAGIAGLGVVGFSAGMAASRFVADRLVARIGQPRVVRAGGSVAAATLALALVVHRPVPSIVAFVVLGLALGPVVPLAFRAAGARLRPNGTSALPLVVTAGYAGSIVGPLVLGFLADAFGLRVAFGLPVVAAAVAAAAAGATHVLPPSRGREALR